MGNYWFFLSYARLDSDPYLKRFYKNLTSTVRRLVGDNEENIGFFDCEDIKPGDEWPITLTGALQTCRAFVPVYSPTYFTKEHCGIEWQIFRERLDAYVAASPGTNRPPLILPVLWVPEDRLPSALPHSVSAVQYKHERFGDAYATEGLRQLMQLGKYRDKYAEFVAAFADKLIDAAKTQNLPSLKALRPLREVKSAWLSDVPVGGAPTLQRSVGPRYVQFVFVAGRRDELRGLRQKLDHYGEEGGMDWHPFFPEVSDEVAILAQDVASMERLIYDPITLDANIIQRIEDAEQKNKIVVIIVDTWTLRLGHYHKFMREYDSRNFLNCLVLVPWNEKDDETKNAQSVLEDAVKLTFLNSALSKDPSCFLDRVNSSDELKRNLGLMLNRARMRIIEKTEVIKRAESAQLISKPIITGPLGSLI